MDIRETTKEQIVQIAEQHAKEGYRLIQIACLKTQDGLSLIYTFETKDYQCVSYKLPVDENPVPSISQVFHYAFMYENEIHDLFGVKIEGMAVDFKGTLYETAVKHPFNVKKEAESKSQE